MTTMPSENASSPRIVAGARRALAAACLLLASLPAAPGGAQNFGAPGPDSVFRLAWQPGERRGQPTVTGTVFNDSAYTMIDVRLRVEALDGAGAVTATAIAAVPGMLTPWSRAAFEVALPARAAAYRVTVLSFDRFEGGTFL
jgi:hypothetical protein